MNYFVNTIITVLKSPDRETILGRYATINYE